MTRVLSPLWVGALWVLVSTTALAQTEGAADGLADVKDPEVRALVMELFNMGLKDSAVRVLQNYRSAPRPLLAPTAKPEVAPLPPKPVPATAIDVPKPAVQAAEPAPVPKPVRPPRWDTPDMRGVELLSDTGARIQVRKFVFNKTNLVEETELQGLLTDLIGKELDHAKLLGAAQRINAYYRSKGYLARAVLPEQPLDFGIVKMVVLETRPILGE